MHLDPPDVMFTKQLIRALDEIKREYERALEGSPWADPKEAIDRNVAWAHEMAEKLGVRL